MKFLIGLIFLISQNSFAQISNGRTIDGTNAPGIDSLKNYVKNPDCAKNVLGITASGGSLTRSTTTPLNEDSGSECAVDASSSGHTYTWALNTFGQGMKGQNCEARFIYEGDASLYKAYINNGSTKITTDLQLESATSAPKIVSINFPCGDLSAENTLVIESTSASAAAISVAKIYAGLATNLSNVAQAQFIGSAYITGTGSCDWVRTNTTLGAFATVAACPGPTVELNPGPGSIQTTDTDLPQFTFNNLPPGNYRAIVTGAGYSGTAGAFQSYTISDGTITSGRGFGMESSAASDSFQFTIEGNFSYTTTANRTFEVYGAATSGVVHINNLNSTSQLKISLYRFPSSSELALKLQDTPWYVDAAMDGANIALSTSAVTSYTEITNGSLTLKPVSGSQPVGVMCSSTNAATAPSTSNTTCAAGDESVGINFAIPKAGTYEVCVQTSHYLDTDANDRLSTVFQLIETPTNAQTITLEGGAKINSFSQPSGGTNLVAYPLTNCGMFNWTSAGIKGVRLMYEQAIVNTPNNSLLLADADSNQGQRNLKWTVKPVTQQIPSPLVINSVTSNSSGLERIERANGPTGSSCTGSPCTISSQSGNWLSSVTRSSTGQYSANIQSGIFSAAPSCTCSTSRPGTGHAICYLNDVPPTSSSFVFGCIDAAGTNVDCTFSIMCHGPR